MAAAAKKVTKIESKTLPIGAVIEYLAIDAIETEKQVRTIFDDETLAELAEDIKANGILQPLLARREGRKIVLIAGERRLRAARLAELVNVPVIIQDADQAKAKRMQLAENIQREDLNLVDVVAAVKELYDELGNLQAVADQVKKSKPWVSKHLAASTTWSWSAKNLLQAGICEDMELLGVFNSLTQLSWSAALDVEKRLKAGTITRKEAQDILRATKEQREKDDAAAEVYRQEQAARKAKESKEKPSLPEFVLGNGYWGAIGKLNGWLASHDYESTATASEKLAEITKGCSTPENDNYAALVKHFEPFYARGQGMKWQLENTAVKAFCGWIVQQDFGDQMDHAETAVFLQGVSGLDYNLVGALNNHRGNIKVFIKKRAEAEESETE